MNCTHCEFSNGISCVASGGKGETKGNKTEAYCAVCGKGGSERGKAMGWGFV